MPSIEGGITAPSVARDASTRRSHPSLADNWSDDESLTVSRLGIDTQPSNHQKPTALNTRPSVIVLGDCSSVTRAQEPASQVVLIPDSVTSMDWLHGYLHLHDYHPDYHKVTVTNNLKINN